MNNYSPIDEHNREHIKTLLNWLLDDVISAGAMEMHCGIPVIFLLMIYSQL